MRFPEFNDEWNKDYLGDLCEVNGRIGFRGYTKSDLVKAGEGALTLGGKHIDSNDELDLSDPEYLSWEKYHESPEIKVKKNNIILAQRGTLGRSALIDKDIGKATINPSMVLLKNFNINNIFLHYFLTTTKIKKEIIRKSSSTAVPMISQREIKKIKISYPSSKEQIKVSNFFSNIDKKIDLMEKTLVLYEKFAKEFIKNIYLNLNTSNKVKLRDIVDSYVSNLSISNLDDNEGEYPLYGAEGIVKFINFYEMKNPYISIIKDGAGVGRLNLCNQDSSALGTLQCLIPKKEFDLHFIYYYLKNLNFKKYIVGSTIPHIYFKDYSKEKLNIPSLDIQRKYGKQCLTLEMKKKIIENAMILLKQYKKYLLQNLFI